MLVAFAEPAMEQLQREAVADARSGGIVTRTLVAHEGVRGVELMPPECDPRARHRIVDELASCLRYVRILAPEDHQHLAPDVAHARERVVMLPLAELLSSMSVGYQHAVACTSGFIAARNAR